MCQEMVNPRHRKSRYILACLAEQSKDWDNSADLYINTSGEQIGRKKDLFKLKDSVSTTNGINWN